MSLVLVHRYGDRAPISVLGRVLAIVVILTGLVLFGLVNGVLATSITSIALETDYKIYGAKVTKCRCEHVGNLNPICRYTKFPLGYASS